MNLGGLTDFDLRVLRAVFADPHRAAGVSFTADDVFPRPERLRLWPDWGAWEALRDGRFVRRGLLAELDPGFGWRSPTLRAFPGAREALRAAGGSVAA